MNKYLPEGNMSCTRDLDDHKIVDAINNKTAIVCSIDTINSYGDAYINLYKNCIGIIRGTEANLELPDNQNISTHIKENKTVVVIPTAKRIDNDGLTVVECSRVLAQKECYESYIKKLVPGDVIDAHIVRIEHYGVFCDIGYGIVALLPINNISETYTADPKFDLKGVHDLHVIIESNNSTKIQLSHKELLGTWEEEVAQFREGQVVYGTVLSSKPYGVFVRISQNLSGLTQQVDDNLQYGDGVLVKISRISAETCRVKLILLESTVNTQTYNQFVYRNLPSHVSNWSYSALHKKDEESKF